ncbi:hypothetical protein MSAN_01122900 [Mycena sanguinolenta]|uniref:Uncharacterized protein n=1 Tax=Mycena sanguinolenta TaxID=230812 RepID=A0A8H6X999_9AGAR|nr:hypothetical protein MSAN_02287600 [Mycena sanguinolenta]KAF7360929.1 hypothetical protein MSAN_01122900 [Mycena sanguinolenta]
MALDLTDPSQRQLAMDRLAVGVGPVLGRHASIVLKQIRRARVEELQRHRSAARQCISNDGSSNANFTVQSNGTVMPAEVFEGIKASTSPTRLPFVLPRDIICLLKKRKSGPRIVDDDVTVALAEHMLAAFKAGHGHPLDLWKSPQVLDSSSEDDDEWDPEGGLPYCPRRKINWRVANALSMITLTIGQLERDQRAEERRRRAERYTPWPQMRIAMQAVHAEVVAAGAVKKLLERDEIGPAPVGFHYVQVNDQVYLASEDEDDENGSIVYVAEADKVVICHRS